MKKRTLGKNNLIVSSIGLGCMTIGKDYSGENKRSAIEIIHRAYNLGVLALRVSYRNFFDTTKLYA